MSNGGAGPKKIRVKLILIANMAHKVDLAGQSQSALGESACLLSGSGSYSAESAEFLALVGLEWLMQVTSRQVRSLRGVFGALELRWNSSNAASSLCCFTGSLDQFARSASSISAVSRETLVVLHPGSRCHPAGLSSTKPSLHASRSRGPGPDYGVDRRDSWQSNWVLPMPWPSALDIW